MSSFFSNTTNHLQVYFGIKCGEQIAIDKSRDGCVGQDSAKYGMAIYLNEKEI